MKFTALNIQLTLFDYNEMRLKTRIPIKRISRERMEEAMADMRKNPRKMVEILRDINDALEKYDSRIANRKADSTETNLG